MEGWRYYAKIVYVLISAVAISIIVGHFSGIVKFPNFIVRNPITSSIRFALNYQKLPLLPTVNLTTVNLTNTMVLMPRVNLFEDKIILKYQKCKYPKIDPFDPATMSYHNHPKIFKCNWNRYGIIENEILRVKVTGIKNVLLYYILRIADSTSKLSVAYKLYVNGRVRPDAKGRLSQKGEYIYYQVNKEFLKLRFTTTAQKTFDEYHHAFLKPPNTKSNVNDRPNIVMIHLDGASDANVQRQMKKTFAYLKRDKNTVIFNQHSVIGDGTTENMCGMFTGHLITELPEARKSMRNGKTCDDWPLIWKDLHKLKYETWFVEEYGPKGGTFHYRLRGFNKPPVKHYYRPLWMILDPIMRPKPLCGTMFHFENLRQYYKTYRNYNKFSTVMLHYLSHDYPSWLRNTDSHVLAFYKYLQQEGHMNNTVVVLYGDHGNRASSFRSTFQGKLEERFPFLGITVPPWFNKHKKLMENFRRNKDVLTTHFDTYSTLQHIMTFPHTNSKTKTKKGVSLFSTDLRKLNRTCTDVSIKPHYCLCLNVFQSISTSDAAANQAVQKVITQMNKGNDKYAKGLCATLSLKTFIRTSRGKGLRGITNYQVKFTVSPSNGLYEATVTCDGGGKKISTCGAPEISRTNLYGSQPECVREIAPRLARYCYCKTYKGKQGKLVNW